MLFYDTHFSQVIVVHNGLSFGIDVGRRFCRDMMHSSAKLRNDSDDRLLVVARQTRRNKTRHRYQTYLHISIYGIRTIVLYMALTKTHSKSSQRKTTQPTQTPHFEKKNQFGHGRKNDAKSTDTHTNSGHITTPHK